MTGLTMGTTIEDWLWRFLPFFEQAQDMDSVSVTRPTGKAAASWRRGAWRFAWLVFALAAGTEVGALEMVEFEREGKRQRVEGKEVVRAEDGGVMLLTADGTLWNLTPEEIVTSRRDERPFAPLSAAEAGKQLQSALPEGFEIHNTAHFVICYNTSRAYAQWCGALYERLYSGFTNYWTKKGVTLREPELPLVCIVFADQAAYAKHVQPELGGTSTNIIAYYSLKTNRVTMYDLTGIEAVRGGGRRGTLAQINQILSQPEAERMVATVIHEATHQIAFNCGFHERYADIPLWVSEGVAMYFEAPDLSNSKGWRSIGEVNRPRLLRYREYAPARPSESLRSLIVNDERFRNPRESLDAYAEAWALNYFLLRQRPKEYAAYVETLGRKTPLVWDSAEARLAEFEKEFGDLGKLDSEFRKQMQKMR